MLLVKLWRGQNTSIVAVEHLYFKTKKGDLKELLKETKRNLFSSKVLNRYCWTILALAEPLMVNPSGFDNPF